MFYSRAKIQESKKFRIYDKSLVKLMTVQEKNALDYFNGTGFYKKHKNPKTLPNIFDIRKSFLLKMEDRQGRDNFLNSYNSRWQNPKAKKEILSMLEKFDKEDGEIFKRLS